MMIGGLAVLVWHRKGWRITKGIRNAFLLAFLLVLLFQLVASLVDPCEISFFGVTASHLTMNMVLMVYVNFLGSNLLNDAYHIIDNQSSDHDEVMASIMESLGQSRSNTNSGLRGYLENCYTIDSKYDSFSLADILNPQMNGVSREESTGKGARTAYYLALAILVMYLAISRFFLNELDLLALANVCTIIFLDASIQMLHQGKLTWSPLYASCIMLLSRIAIVAFSGEFWLVGHSLAYFIFGLAIAIEIVNQRLPLVDGLDAGAAAYFGQTNSDKEKARALNLAGSPEFGFIYVIVISVLFLVFGQYAIGTQSIEIFSSRWPLWSIGVGLTIINIEVLLIVATIRSISLYSKNLLQVHTYFCFSGYKLPFFLATALVIFTILAGVLLMLFTNSPIFLELAIFVPLLFITTGYSWTNYVRMMALSQ
jgi:hypothetical protein